MIQQQIVEYAKAQLGLGISEEVIKSALVQAGWSVIDVDDSIKGVVQKKAPEVVRILPTSISRQNVAPASSTDNPLNLKNLFGGAVDKGDSSFAIPADSLKAKISEIPKTPADITSLKKMSAEKLPSQESPGRSKIVLIVVVVVALASVAGAVVLYMNNKKLSAHVDTLTAETAAAGSTASGLSTQLADLTTSKQEANDQVVSLTKEKNQLRAELSFFITPPLLPGATSSPVIAFSLTGTVALDDKLQYSLTTSEGLKLTVKNSKDPKVDSALKPLIGMSAEISGTHAPLFKDVTVSAVNGVSL